MLEEELVFRKKLIGKIEGFTGTLQTLNYHEMSTRDMVMLYNALFLGYNKQTPVEYYTYINEIM